jgi:hypothetical protein
MLEHRFHFSNVGGIELRQHFTEGAARLFRRHGAPLEVDADEAHSFIVHGES